MLARSTSTRPNRFTARPCHAAPGFFWPSATATIFYWKTPTRQARQTGALEFRVADLERDRHWLDVIPELAKRLTAEYPSHVEPLVQRWLWAADRYAQV